MKKYISLLIVILMTTLFTGCGNLVTNDIVKIQSPDNNNLSIRGKWEVQNYKILDPNIYSKKEVKDLSNQVIEIGSNNIIIDSKIYNSVNYKLKVVDRDYKISYESKFTVGQLGSKNNDVDLISAHDKNNIIFDFFKLDNDEGYIYYQGILLTVKKVGDIDNDIFGEAEKNANSKEISNYNKENNIGIYMTLKEPRKKQSDGTYSDEKYRTLWINYSNGKLQKIEELNGIIYPRMTGIWTLKKENIEVNGKHQEYFITNQIDRKNVKSEKSVLSDTNVYRNINFIGNDYIATEVYTGDDFSNKFPKYELLPMDNISYGKSIIMQDIFSKDVNELYKKDFNDAINSLSDEEKEGLKKQIDYSNFTLKRENGKWSLMGKISPINNNDKSYNYDLSIKPNENLVRYDTLVMPWRVLRGEVPFIKDAYTSPNGKIAILIIDNELLIYEINNNKLSENPIGKFALKNGESVIMADWCSDDYIDYWGNTFKEYQKEINKER